MEVKIFKVSCKRCKHSWVPRKTIIYVCPACHSALWNVEPDKKSKLGINGK